MKNIFVSVFLICVMGILPVFAYAGELKDTYIFMDISGSSSDNFESMQNYVVEEVLPTIEKQTNLSIYKFYGKCINIYEQKVRNDFDLDFAKDRILKLLPNGPWTNLDLVKSIIKQKNIDLQTTNVYILTDGHQELEDGSNNYQLSKENINTFFDDCDLMQKNAWFVIVPKYKQNQNESISVADVTAIEKKSFDFDLHFLGVWVFLIPLIILALMIALDFVSFVIWKKEKNKSEEMRQFESHSKKWMFRFVATLVLAVTVAVVFLLRSFSENKMTIIFFVLIAIAYCVSVYNIIRNVSYSGRIEKLYKRLIKDVYYDFAEEFGIKSSYCNDVIYLKRESLENTADEDKQIAIGLALKKCNDSNAIGIQKFGHFYFFNLEKIFEQLDVKIDPSYRDNIKQFIENSYGNDKLDKEDWAIGASIGLITGLMDIFLVGEPGDSKLQKGVDYLADKIVLYAAKIIGYKGKSIDGAVKHLEDKYWVPYDDTTISAIGMDAKNHHLRSLAHSNDVIGLLFAILDTRFSIEKSINEDKLYTVVTCTYQKSPEVIAKIKEDPTLEFIFFGALVRKVAPLSFASGNKKGEEKTVDDIAKNALYRILYEKCKGADEKKITVLCILFGFVLWLGHLFSDVAGASSTVKKGNRGTGIAAPLQELFINVPIMGKIKKYGADKVEERVKSLAEEMFKKGFDNRFYTVQKIPVVINEFFTKIVYVIKNVVKYDKEYNINDLIVIFIPEGFSKDSITQLSGCSNFELDKTLFVSYSVFSATDVTGAFITSGAVVDGFKPNLDTFLSINYPGLIKFGKKAVNVLLSYMRRWTASPDKIKKEIERLAIEYNKDDDEMKIEDARDEKDLLLEEK